MKNLFSYEGKRCLFAGCFSGMGEAAARIVRELGGSVVAADIRKPTGFDYERYHEVVTSMLSEVLRIQHRGDKAASDAFIERYTSWDEEVHGALASAMREARRYRYRKVQYAILGQ